MHRQHSVLIGIFVAFAIAVSLLWNPLSYLTAQEKDDKPKPKEKQEVIEMRGEVTKNPKYEVKQEKNDPKGEEVATRKGAFTCDVHVDNRTRLFVHRIYINRRYYGSVPRLGDLYVYDVVSGTTEIYAEADMINGVRYWGPMTVNCPSYSTYAVRLN